MRHRPVHPLLGLLLALAGLVTGVGHAQTPVVAESQLNLRRAQATRAELETTLLQIDTILGSPGYSSRIRDAKRREQALVRQRLQEGDLFVGDVLTITVLGEDGLTGSFPVGAGRMLLLPGLEPIPLHGVLRSEAEAHIATALRRYLRDPTVRVLTSVRMSVLGAVGKQGFYQIPADVLVSDAIMAAGGPAGGADPNRTEIRRGGRVLLTEEEVRNALVAGATLDQLNLRAGDEMIVDARLARRASSVSLFSVIGLVTSTAWLLVRVF